MKMKPYTAVAHALLGLMCLVLAFGCNGNGNTTADSVEIEIPRLEKSTDASKISNIEEPVNTIFKER